MNNRLKITALMLLLGLVAHGSARAQTTPSADAAAPAAAGAQSRVLGEVLAIDLNTRQVTVRTAQAGEVIIACDEKTIYRRVPAGEKTLDKAITIRFADIGVGDRVIARGNTNDASKALLARSLIVVDDKEIAQKKERDRAEWTRRGVEGVVTAARPELNELTLLTHSPEGARSLVVAAGESRVRRYAPDSVRYSDATSSSLKEVKVGDRLRALGDKSGDGTRFTAEEIVFGSIRTVGGFITAIDAASGEIKINDIPSGKPLTIVVKKESLLRRLPPALVKLLSEAPSGDGARATQHGRGAELQRQIEQQPALAVDGLKVGDAILASSTTGTTPSRVSAIILVVGVEDFLKRFMQQPKGRDFNVSLGLPSGIG